MCAHCGMASADVPCQLVVQVFNHKQPDIDVSEWIAARRSGRWPAFLQHSEWIEASDLVAWQHPVCCCRPVDVCQTHSTMIGDGPQVDEAVFAKEPAGCKDWVNSSVEVFGKFV